MSNDYFNYDTLLMPNQLARASDINSRFQENETAWAMLPAKLKLQQNRVTYAEAGGTANALTAALDFAPPAYVAGLGVRVQIGTTNTNAATLNVNGLGAVAIKRPNGDALSAGDLVAGNIVEFIYDGTYFKLAGDGIHSTTAAAAAASASAAATSASAASASASAASTSASGASTSAAAAAASAAAAAASATAAAGSATTASTQATNAATSASAASTSASAAAGSATTAGTQATNAASSATAAAGSATTASGHATNASTSASSAATSATNAANSASASATSASNAATSESNAAASAASINPANLMHLTGAETATGVKTFSTAGTPAIVNSTDSTAKKIELRDNGAMKGAVGTGATGAALMDSGGTPRLVATTGGADVTGTLAVGGALSTTGNVTLGDTGDEVHTFNGSLTPINLSNTNGIDSVCGHASFSGSVARHRASRVGSSAFQLLTLMSDNVADTEYNVTGLGAVSSDGGTAMTTPADYADMKEWADGNPDGEDRIGYSVVLEGEKVRKATEGDDPEDVIGIASGNPSVCGGAGWNRWVGKFLTDDFNRNILNDDGERVLSDFYDPDAPYTPRKERAEWDPIGLVGRIPMRKGCPTNPRWRKMRDVSATVEEWLVR